MRGVSGVQKNSQTPPFLSVSQATADLPFFFRPPDDFVLSTQRIDSRSTVNSRIPNDSIRAKSRNARQNNAAS